LIANSKIAHYNITNLELEINRITESLNNFVVKSGILEFESNLLKELSDFNNKYFPVPEYKYKLKSKEIDGDIYGPEKSKLFLPTFERLVAKYHIVLSQKNKKHFLTNGIQTKSVKKLILFIRK